MFIQPIVTQPSWVMLLKQMDKQSDMLSEIVLHILQWKNLIKCGIPIKWSSDYALSSNNHFSEGWKQIKIVQNTVFIATKSCGAGF